jgi:hypothetical protein
MELKIDTEFKDLIPVLSVDEVLNLEQNLNAQVTEDEKEKIRASILARLAPKNHMLSPVDVQ